jgi:hypothetical protein
MLGRVIWNPIGALIVGVLAVGLGVAIASGVDVSCKSKTAEMAEGVTCIGRAGDIITYSSWQSQQHQYSMVAFGVGGVLLVGGSIAMAVRRKRRWTAGV